MRQPWTAYSEAQQLFDLRPLDQTAPKIEPDVSVLVLVHPKDLSPATQFAIDQYALRGGHLLVFVDPLARADQSGEEGRNPMAAMGADKSSHLKSLLEAWGVQFDPGEVIADRGYALTVSTRSGEPVEHLGFLGLGKDAFTADDVITAGLSNVNVASAGSLEPLKDAKVRFEPLLKSSTDAEPLPVTRFRMLFDPATLRDGFKPTGRRYTIAARVSGNVHSAFPAGPPAGVTLPPGQAALKGSQKPLSLVVFADSDLLSDYLWAGDQNFFGQRLIRALAAGAARGAARARRERARSRAGCAMNARRVGVLLVAGLAIIGFAMWIASQRHLEGTTLTGDLVLADLERGVNAVTAIALRKGDGTHVTLKKEAAGWSVGEREWPADASKVRKLLLDLGALNIVEEKTRLAANFPQLGVEDVSSPQASGTRVEIVSPARTWAKFARSRVFSSTIFRAPRS